MEWKKEEMFGVERKSSGRMKGRTIVTWRRRHSEKDECGGKGIERPTVDSQICCDAEKEKFPHRTLLLC